MGKKRGIFIFVKDRTENIDRLMATLQPLQLDLFVIDDSFDPSSSKVIREIVCRWQAIYVNAEYYDKFLWVLNIREDNYKFLIRKPGRFDWNLGYVRNLALLICKSLQFEEIAFFDDDIVPDSQEQILDLFNQLSTYNFVGARISGLVDDSIIGHIARKFGATPESDLLSGGCLFFCPEKISGHFLNIYNEDWIWLLFNSGQFNFKFHGDIYHLIKDPFDQAVEKVKFQEFGEIFLNGIQNQNNLDSTNLESQVYWTSIIESRRNYLTFLGNHKAIAENTAIYEIINSAIKESKLITGTHLAKMYVTFRGNCAAFNNLYSSL